MRFLYSLLLGLFVVAALAAAGPLHAMPHWVPVKDAYRLHQRRVVTQADGSETVLGELYQVEPGDVRAECYGQAPVAFATEDDARRYVLGCEVWR